MRIIEKPPNSLRGSKDFRHRKDSSAKSASPAKSRKTQTKEEKETQISKRKLRTEKEEKTRESVKGSRFKNAANQVLQVRPLIVSTRHCFRIWWIGIACEY